MIDQQQPDAAFYDVDFVAACNSVPRGVTATPRRRSLTGLIAALVLGVACLWSAQASDGAWRAATDKELRALLPARAVVEKEHIETELRTASGVTDGRGKFIAGVVLITAGYSADGKYSHYLLTQVPLTIGGLSLRPGEYVFGWKRDEDSLDVRFYEAANGNLLGQEKARRLPSDSKIESFRIWPVQSKAMLQLGRFGVNYRLGK